MKVMNTAVTQERKERNVRTKLSGAELYKLIGLTRGPKQKALA